MLAGQQADAGTGNVLTVLDPETGLAKNPNRETIAAGYKVAGIAYDGVREDTFYIFEKSETDPFATARVRVRTLNPRTGAWKEVATATGLPPPSQGAEFIVLNKRIAYLADIAGNGGPASTGIAFLNTEDLKSVVAIAPPNAAPSTAIMALPFKALGLVGIPDPSGASQRIDVVRRVPEPGMICSGTGPGGATNFCDLVLHRVTLTPLGISALEANPSPVGQYPASDPVRRNAAGGASWTAESHDRAHFGLVPPAELRPGDARGQRVPASVRREPRASVHHRAHLRAGERSLAPIGGARAMRAGRDDHGVHHHPRALRRPARPGGHDRGRPFN